MDNNDRASIFRGAKNVSSFATNPASGGFNQDPLNSGSMASPTANNNPSTSPTMQHPSTGSKATLASLAAATEPTNLSFNQQTASVGTFPQRPTGGSPTANTSSPLGFSFGQGSNSNLTAGFSFVPPSTTNGSGFAPPNQPPTNPPRFSFSNVPPANNSQPASFNVPTANPQVRQSVPSYTFTPSAQKQDLTNNKIPSSLPFTFNSTTQDIQNNSSTMSKYNQDPPTPTSHQPSLSNQAQDETDATLSSADESLMSKKLNTKLRDPTVLVVDRTDPTSPLYSLKRFEELNLKPDLLKGIYSMGFQVPSKIQEIALPSLLNNPPRNIIAQSQSGTGKTAAFSLAILSRIDPAIQSPQALILSPTFELALQIGSVIEKMAKYLPYIKIAYAVRDPSISNRDNLVRGQLLTEPLVIGTPGTVEDWCGRKRVINLQQLRICCIDEADVMIDIEGFQQTCIQLVQGLNTAQCQMMLFSATYSDEVMNFARTIVPNPLVLRLKREKQALTNIQQFFIRCNNPEEKYRAIEQIYTSLTIGQAMIFCRTKATARELNIRMANQNHSVRELTSNLDIEQRASIIRNFRDGVFRVLISTNVTARGIDIDDVSLVINYDMPVNTKFEPDYETYLHRIGRCGRFGRLGFTFNLISSGKDMEIMKAIEEYFSHPVDEITIEGISHLEEDQE